MSQPVSETLVIAPFFDIPSGNHVEFFAGYPAGYHSLYCQFLSFYYRLMNAYHFLGGLPGIHRPAEVGTEAVLHHPEVKGYGGAFFNYVDSDTAPVGLAAAAAYHHAGVKGGAFTALHKNPVVNFGLYVNLVHANLKHGYYSVK